MGFPQHLAPSLGLSGFLPVTAADSQHSHSWLANNPKPPMYKTHAYSNIKALSSLKGRWSFFIFIFYNYLLFHFSLCSTKCYKLKIKKIKIKMKLLEVWRMQWCCVLQTAFREWCPMLDCFPNACKTWQTNRQLMQLLPNIMFEVMPSQQKFTSFCLKLLSPSSYFLTYFLAPSWLCEGSKICKLRHEDEMRKEKRKRKGTM